MLRAPRISYRCKTNAIVVPSSRRSQDEQVKLWILWKLPWSWRRTQTRPFWICMPGIFPGGTVLKNPPANGVDIGDSGWTPGWGRYSGVENANPLQYSCLGNSMDRGGWWATIREVTKSQTQLSDWEHIHILSTHAHCTHVCIEPGRLQSMGLQRVRHD